MLKNEENKPNMNQEDILNTNAQDKMTPEEYAKARDDAKAHLEAELPFLRVESEYHELQATIQESKMRKEVVLIQRGQLYAKQQEAAQQQAHKPTTPDSEEPTKPPRNLKDN